MKIRLLISAAVACSFVQTVSAAADVVVCEGAPPYESIQKAVNEAPEGSVIRVCSGTYHEQVTINTPNLSLRAQGKVLLVKPTASSGPAYGFTVLGAHTTISGFTITGFTQTRSAGIWVNNAAGAELGSNLIYGNCNGILISNATGTSILGNNVSQNPYPDAASVTPQPGIPPPPSEPSDNCNLPFDSQSPGADGYGVKSDGAGNSMIRRNDVQQNGACGIQLRSDGGGSRISENHLFANSGTQNSDCGNIDVRSPRSGGLPVVIENNNISTGLDGIFLKNADRVELSGNRIMNTSQGINLIDSNRNILTRNSTTNNLTGVVLTGRQNEFGHNNASGNEQGFFVTVDGCPAGTGSYGITDGNRFTNNVALNNSSIDVADYSSYSGMACSTTTPPITTRDIWVKTECRTSIPASICRN